MSNIHKKVNYSAFRGNYPKRKNKSDGFHCEAAVERNSIWLSKQAAHVLVECAKKVMQQKNRKLIV